MSGHSRLRSWQIEEQWPECYGETRSRFGRAEHNYKLTLEFDCDAAFLAGLQVWLQQQGISGAERINRPERVLPSAQPRLTEGVLDGELVDEPTDKGDS